TRLTRLATANGEQRIGPQRHPDSEEPAGNRIEERNEKRYPGAGVPGALRGSVDGMILHGHGEPPRAVNQMIDMIISHSSIICLKRVGARDPARATVRVDGMPDRCGRRRRRWAG